MDVAGTCVQAAYMKTAGVFHGKRSFGGTLKSWLLAQNYYSKLPAVSTKGEELAKYHQTMHLATSFLDKQRE